MHFHSLHILFLMHKGFTEPGSVLLLFDKKFLPAWVLPVLTVC